MRRKKTDREREMLLNRKRHKHELRKRRKQKEKDLYYESGGEVLLKPHIEAMFRKSKKEKLN